LGILKIKKRRVSLAIKIKDIKKISAKTGAKEGKNIKVGSVDEVHELKDNSSIMPIRQALSTQDEPIYGELTTEGFTRDGYLDERLKEARKVLKGELDRPRWLIWMHTQDSEEEIWRDESSWVKSNPDLGVIKKWSFLRQMVAEAKESSATRAFVLAKDFNLPQSASSAWLQQSQIINLETFDLKDFVGSFYISGNDFAETTDLCASTILLKKPNDKKTYLHTRYWIPESKLETSPDDVDYRQWEKEGWLTIVPGNVVESSMIADWHFALLEEYDLKPFKSGFDNRFAKDFQNRYLDLFGEKITVNIPQDFKVLNNPMRTLEADMRDKLVNYQNNPVCYWCFCNTGIVLDKLGRIMPTKMDSTKRIDGTASKIIAYATLEWYRSEFMALVG
jgi:phage terminase large subunit-like protein